MTSPVDTSVKYFTSDMPGAPVLAGQAGSLIGLLDACLVNGWGVQTATSVVVAGGVATATFPANHAGFVDAVVLVAGATPASLNGEQKVTARAANVIKWATAAVDGTAAGTITVKMAPAGFNKLFSGTNLAVYKSANPMAHGQFFRVNDAASIDARTMGYETMTAVSTGTGLFPSTAHVSGGYYWAKSSTADSTPTPWAVVCDGRTVHYLIAPALPVNGSAYRSMAPYSFGDMVPRRASGDVFATLLNGAASSSVFYSSHATMLTEVLVDSGVAVPRGVMATGTSVRGTAMRQEPWAGASLPNTVAGQIEFTPIQFRDTATSHVRAALAGVSVSTSRGADVLLQYPWQRVKMAGGKTYLLVLSGINGHASSTSMDALAYDITGPWR